LLETALSSVVGAERNLLAESKEVEKQISTFAADNSHGLNLCPGKKQFYFDGQMKPQQAKDLLRPEILKDEVQQKKKSPENTWKTRKQY
jgi:hypothetical protein